MQKVDAKGRVIQDPRARIIQSGGSGGGSGAVSSVNGKTGAVVLTNTDVGAAATSHNHDSRYYTETETDTLLSGKAASSHTHVKSDVTDFPTTVSSFTNDAGYLTSHQSLSAYRTSAAQDVIDAGKQDTISDLSTIRSGAALGATAIQSHQSLAAYRTSSAQDTIDAGKVNEPSTEGTNGQVLTTDGSGGRTWTTVGGGGGGGITFTKLWENDDDTVGFDAQAVSIQGGSYSMFLVSNKARKANPYYHNDVVLKDQSAELVNKDNQANAVSRSVTITSTTATFGSGYTGNQANVNYCIPKEIYGISGVTIS